MKTSRSTRVGFIAILVLLTLSTFLNLFLYLQLRKYYTLLYAVELDPLALSSFQNHVDERKLADSSADVVFFGDSRAAQWQTRNWKHSQFRTEQCHRP
jgi:hypothetical protein